MGADLFKRNVGVRECLEKLDELIISRSGNSLLSSLYDQRQRAGAPLKLTSLSHPLIFMLQYAMGKTLLDEGLRPDGILGVSLGEWVAASLCGIISPEEALCSIHEQVHLLERTCHAGGMLVILAPKSRIIEDLSPLATCEIAAELSDQHVIIAGSEHELEFLSKKASARGFMSISLPVEYGFHSPLIDSAETGFRPLMEKVKIDQPTIPFYSSRSASRLQSLDRDHFWRVVRDPMYVQQTISTMLQNTSSICVDLSPQGSLATLLRKGSSTGTHQVFDIMTPFGHDQQKFEVALNAGHKVQKHRSSVNHHSYKSSHQATLSRTLGDKTFRQDHHIEAPIMAGAMYKGIASANLVIAMSQSGLIGSLGTGGLDLDQVESSLKHIRSNIGPDRMFAVNHLSQPGKAHEEERRVDLWLQHGIKLIEAAAFVSISPALVRYRILGLLRDGRDVICSHRIMAKVSDPRVAKAFMSPPPPPIIQNLRKGGQITSEQAEMAAKIPMADSLTVESDSGGHTSQGLPAILIPTIRRLRDLLMREHQYRKKIFIGAAGGIGTPEAISSAFVLGADYVVTGSINQSCIEAATSPRVKEILGGVGIEDTEYAPAADMFEIGGKVQVVKKGLLFAARANRLQGLYHHFDSLDALPLLMQRQIQEKFFKRSFEEVWREVEAHLNKKPNRQELPAISQKSKMALIFKWYFAWTTKLAIQGSLESPADYQIHCGPAMGAFNAWAKGTKFHHIDQRRVGIINHHLMEEAERISSCS